MTQLNYQIPILTNPNSSEDPKIHDALQQIQTVVNNQLGGDNLNNTLTLTGALSAGTVSASSYTGTAGGIGFATTASFIGPRFRSNAQTFNTDWISGTNVSGGDTWDAKWNNAANDANVRGLAFLATSAAEAKANPEPVSDVLPKLQGVGVYRYTMRQDAESELVEGDGPVHVGVMAHEVAEAFPDVPALVGRDADGNADSVDYGKLAAVALQAVKELSARVVALEAKRA